MVVDWERLRAEAAEAQEAGPEAGGSAAREQLRPDVPRLSNHLPHPSPLEAVWFAVRRAVGVPNYHRDPVANPYLLMDPVEARRLLAERRREALETLVRLGRLPPSVMHSEGQSA